MGCDSSVVLPCDSLFFNSAVSETVPKPQFEIGQCQLDYHFTEVVENASNVGKMLLILLNALGAYWLWQNREYFIKSNADFVLQL